MLAVERKQKKEFTIAYDPNAWIRELPPAEVGRRLVEENLKKIKERETSC